MDWARIREHLQGLWYALRGVRPVPRYLSYTEILYVLRGDLQLALRLEDCNNNVLHPFICNRNRQVVAFLDQRLFVGLLEDGWIASDEDGNYRPTALGLDKLAWHERLHQEAGDCLECGKPIGFFPVDLAVTVKDAEGKNCHIHYDCYINTKTSAREGSVPMGKH